MLSTKERREIQAWPSRSSPPGREDKMIIMCVEWGFVTGHVRIQTKRGCPSLREKRGCTQRRRRLKSKYVLSER